MNGTPRPAEYTASSCTPSPTVSCAAATDRMALRMGPMHGVHPKANAMPTRIAPKNPAGLLVGLHALLVVEPADLQHAHHVEAEQDDDDAGNLAEQLQVLHQQRADGRGRCAKRNEDEEKPSTKASDMMTARRRFVPDDASAAAAPVPRISSSVTPDTNER